MSSLDDAIYDRREDLPVAQHSASSLPDGRPAPVCMVMFQCPRCKRQTEVDAYRGVPLHRACPGAPIMVPIHIGKVHAIAYNIQPMRNVGARGKNGDPV